MSFVRTVWPIASLILCGLTAPVLALPAPGALRDIAPGLWELRTAGEAPRAVCIGDTLTLLQVRHRETACSRLTIAQSATSITVHYSCPGAGWGRTTLRVSTPTSVRISTQGIADNAPFDFDVTVNRLGACRPHMASR